MYQDVLDEIEFTVKKEGRKSEDVSLVIVSKTHMADKIRPVLDDGGRIFGENKVQEAQKKWPELLEDYKDVELHLIGPLQSNKAEGAVALFDVIQSVDRKKIADYIAKAQAKLEKQVEVYIQVNIGDEPQKAGIALNELDEFYEYCKKELSLNVKGLMCIPPNGKDAGPYFALLNKRAKALGLEGLSMGMSGDFKTAIRLGATHIRVGSAIFGARGQ